MSIKFCKILADWIDTNCYTKESVALAIGVDPITLDRWIDDVKVPTPRILNRVSAVTDISLEDLLESAGYDREHASHMSKKPSVFREKLVKRTV